MKIYKEGMPEKTSPLEDSLLWRKVHSTRTRIRRLIFPSCRTIRFSVLSSKKNRQKTVKEVSGPSGVKFISAITGRFYVIVNLFIEPHGLVRFSAFARACGLWVVPGASQRFKSCDRRIHHLRFTKPLGPVNSVPS